MRMKKKKRMKPILTTTLTIVKAAAEIETQFQGVKATRKKDRMHKYKMYSDNIQKMKIRIYNTKTIKRICLLMTLARLEAALEAEKEVSRAK